MTYVAANNKLRSFANLPGGDENVPSLESMLGDWKRTGHPIVIRPLVRDVLECLQSLVLAAQTNGSLPFSSPVEREPAYSMSCIFRSLAGALASERAASDLASSRQLAGSLLVIAHAWSQYLAGDVADVFQDLRDTSLVDEDFEHAMRVAGVLP